jgi:molybdopterin-guanine dinucleotide biosynthesis protein A
MPTDIPPASPGDSAPGWNAIIVAGGRAKRLGGIDKTALIWDGRRLLDGVLAATAGARRVCVVGSDAALPASVLRTVERPRWSGPAAAIVAALHALSETRNDAQPDGPSADASAAGPATEWVVVLAADLVRPAAAVAALLAELNRVAPSRQSGSAPNPPLDGLIGVDAGGRRQPLLGVYRQAALEAAAGRIGSARNLSVTGLIGQLDMRELPLPDGLSEDVDTPADAARLGIDLPGGPDSDPSEPSTTSAT